MITDDEKQSILSVAYVPEHSVGLMTSVSGGEPFLIDGYFCCLCKDRLIVVGYPLDRAFRVDALEDFLKRMRRRFSPHRLSIIAPELPASLVADCSEQDEDDYYTLDSPGGPMRQRLLRVVERARPNLLLERSFELRREHGELIDEFMHRVQPSHRIRDLYAKMPECVAESTDCLVLSALTHDRRLTAFYLVDCAPREFSTYVIGCHSKATLCGRGIRCTLP
jgi:hypothetical protein